MQNDKKQNPARPLVSFDQSSPSCTTTKSIKIQTAGNNNSNRLETTTMMMTSSFFFKQSRVTSHPFTSPLVSVQIFIFDSSFHHFRAFNLLIQSSRHTQEWYIYSFNKSTKFARETEMDDDNNELMHFLLLLLSVCLLVFCCWLIFMYYMPFFRIKCPSLY